MAHFAKLGINSKVIAVHVVDNKDCQNADGIEDEEVGRQYLERIHNWPLWKNTKALRGNYAGIGMIYDEDNDIFINKKPYASWVLDVPTASWKSPIGDAPELEEAEHLTHRYEWDEANGSWNKVER